MPILVLGRKESFLPESGRFGHADAFSRVGLKEKIGQIKIAHSQQAGRQRLSIGRRGGKQVLKFVITGYVENALSQAEYDKLEDGTFSGRISSCKGVIAFGKTLRECEDELRSTLEDWVLVGLKLGHNLPVLGGYDLNKVPKNESMAAL